MSIRRIINAWQSWRMRCALYRNAPEMRALHKALNAQRKRHGTTRPTLAAIKNTMTERLRGELQR